jgi:hypothetical protein
MELFVLFVSRDVNEMGRRGDRVYDDADSVIDTLKLQLRNVFSLLKNI